MNDQEVNDHGDDDALSESSAISDAPAPPPRPRRVPAENRTIILRNTDIVQHLLHLGETTGMTITLLSATGSISYAELRPRTSLEPLTVIRGSHRIDAIFGRIYPPFQNALRHTMILVTISGIPNGASRGDVLVSHGDVEVKIQLQRALEAPAPQVPFHRMIYKSVTIGNNQDIFQWFASLSVETGLTIRIACVTGKISDGTIFSISRQLQLTNVGRADILQLTGDFKPDGTGNMLVTLSGVSGGTAKAYSLITDGDVLLDAYCYRRPLA